MGDDDDATIDYARLESELGSINGEFWRSDFNALPLVVEIISNDLEENRLRTKTLKDIIGYQYKIVNEGVEALIRDHYEPFNASVEGFGKIFDAYADSQVRVRRLREQVQHCRALISERKQGLRESLLDKIKTESALGLLRKINELNDAPSHYDRLLSSKKFYACVEYVQRVQEMMFSEELKDIGALSDLQRAWPIKRIEIGNVLVDELGNLLYSKWLYSPAFKESKREMEEEDQLYTCLHALFALGHIQTALQIIYSRVRLELSTIFEFHKKMAKKAVQEKGLTETNKEKKDEGGKGDNQEKDEGGGGGFSTLGDQSILSKMLEDVLEAYTATLEKYIKLFKFVHDIVTKEAQALLSISFTLEDVWIALQNEVVVFLSSQLKSDVRSSFRDTLTPKYANKSTDDSKKSKEMELTFFFSDSAAWSTPVDVTAQTTERNWLPCPATPYQIIAVYPPTWSFFVTSRNMLAESKRIPMKGLEGRNAVLSNFFDQFIRNTLVPRLTEDIHEKTSLILTGADAFMAVHKLINVKGSVIPRSAYLLVSTWELFGAICEVVCNIVALPSFVRDFIPVLETQLERNANLILDRVRSVTAGTHTGGRLDRNGAKITTLLNTSSAFIQLLREELHLETAVPTGGEASITLDQYEIDFDNGLPEPPLDSDLRTLLPLPTVAMLCHLFESLRYVSNFIRSLSNGEVESSFLPYFHGVGKEAEEAERNESNNPITAGSLNRRRASSNQDEGKNSSRRLSLRSRLLPTLTMMKDIGAYGVSSPPLSPSHDKEGGATLEISKLLNEAKPHLSRLNKMSDRYDNLSFRMIFTLKLEVRVVVRSHIMGILKASYAFEVESNTTIIEADGFLHELHAHLLAIDQILLSHVSLPVRMFVYDGLQDLLPNALMKGLKHLFYRKVSFPGVERLCGNISAIQQTLTSIGLKGSINRSKCDRAISYFRLLLLSEGELVTFIKEHPKDFSFDELTVIWSLEGPMRKATVESSRMFEKLAMANFV